MKLKQIFLVLIALSFPSIAPLAAGEFTTEQRELIDLNSAQMEAYILRHEDASIREIAHSKFMLVLAIGVVESLDMVDGTASNVQFERWDQTVLDIRIVGNTAIIMTRVDAKGTVNGNPLPGKLVMTHTYVREDEDTEWRLLQRTMTPVTVPEEFYDRLLHQALPTTN